MSSVGIVRSILASNSALIAVIPAARIAAGDLPLDTVLPAISVIQISGNQRLTMAMTEPKQINTDRVQVSVLYKGPDGTPSGGTGYPGVKAAMALVRAAMPNRNGIVGTLTGYWVDSILPDTVGPDLQDEAGQIFSQSIDFIVRWRIA